MVVTAGRQLARTLELHSLNDLGFSKRYVRCLQISEVVNSMKDLMDFSREHKVGPIEGLKNYPRHSTAAKFQMQKMHDMEQLAAIQGLPTDRNTLSKLIAIHPGLNSQMSNNHHMVCRGGTLSGSPQSALALTSYQNLLTRQNSMNSNSSSLQHEASSSSFCNSNHNPSSAFQGPTAQNLSASGFSNSQLPSQQQQQQRQTLNVNGMMHQQSHQHVPSQGNTPAIQQHMIQQLLQDLNNNGGGGGGGGEGVQRQHHFLAGQNGNGSNAASVATAGSINNMEGSIAMRSTPSRSNSFKAASNSDSCSAAAGGNGVFNQKAADLPQNLHLSEEILQDIAHEFTDNGLFEFDYDDNIEFGWKG
ncbi:hypothetical protein U1Q18_045544 [Sarracenia purpurea var. burkii]